MNILTIGAGAYGLALSTILSDKNEVTIYSSLEEEINNLKTTYKNENLFPNIELSKKLKFTNKIETQYDLIVIAIPTNFIKQELLKIKDKIQNTPILIASKGTHEGKLPYQVVKEITKTKISVISGPSFAKDMIEKQHITVTLAGNLSLENLFNEEYITIEKTKDIIGTEICGVVKNIYAIGAGILEGMNVSASTKAAYLTRVVNETKEIIKKLNGKEKTILLSCGIGDTILTCTSTNSRNFTLGYMIGKKENKNQIEDYKNNTTVEGLNSLKEVEKIINIKEFKTINTIYNIIYNNEQIDILKA